VRATSSQSTNNGLEIEKLIEGHIEEHDINVITIKQELSDSQVFLNLIKMTIMWT
jgi:hypothetical protein